MQGKILEAEKRAKLSRGNGVFQEADIEEHGPTRHVLLRDRDKLACDCG